MLRTHRLTALLSRLERERSLRSIVPTAASRSQIGHAAPSTGQLPRQQVVLERSSYGPPLTNGAEAC